MRREGIKRGLVLDEDVSDVLGYPPRVVDLHADCICSPQLLAPVCDISTFLSRRRLRGEQVDHTSLAEEPPDVLVVLLRLSQLFEIVDGGAVLRRDVSFRAVAIDSVPLWIALGALTAVKERYVRDV